MSLTMALVRSINIIPVKLSIALGNGNPRAGRVKIRDIARKAGLRTPLIDTPSMPIGANEVTVLDHTGGYGIFVNDGMSTTPHAVLEVRSSTGDLIWRFDRDGPKSVRVIDPKVAQDMNLIMQQVIEAGTARRAILPGIKGAGKTGTTNAYRDAWFVGYTGNYIAGVWFGNDDYSSTNRMTGGALPAATWQEIMLYAHQGIELKPIPGLGQQAPTAPRRPLVADARRGGATVAQRPSVLTRRGAEVLVRVEQAMDEATRLLAARDVPGSRADAQDALPQSRSDTFASAGRTAGEATRGN
jgi:penicillin-binding protein 1A